MTPGEGREPGVWRQPANQPPRTARLAVGAAPDAARAGGFLFRTVRGFTGAVAAGLVVLTLVIIGAQVYSSQQDTPGPGAEMVAGNVVAAVAAVLCQRLADRWRGARAVVGVLGVLVLAAAALWLTWWR